MGVLIFLMIGVPVILLILSIVFFIQKDTKKGKLFLILMGIYLLIAFGICGIMMANFTLDTKQLKHMKMIFPLEFYISDLAAIGFFLFFPAILFLIVAVILLIAKQKKAAKVLFIISGCCFVIAIGACGFGA